MNNIILLKVHIYNIYDILGIIYKTVGTLTLQKKKNNNNFNNLKQ